MSTVGFIERVDETTKVLKEAVERINNTVLTDRTLTNLAQGVVNFNTVSERAITLVENLNHFVTTNSSPVTGSLTNLAHFSEDLTRLAGELRETVAENRTNISATVKSLEESSRAFSGVAKDFDQGRGLAGSLFRDPQLQLDLSNTLHHLAVVSSNIARYGLLYKPKPPKAQSSRSARSPRDAAN
jgi:methyl-accepting chemotaxis protein